jgi:hypothetical protein
VFKPLRGGELAWVFDRRSGHIVARCEGVPTAKANHQLLADDLAQCTPANAVLLSGRVRFALGTTPDPAAAREAPLPLAARLDLMGTGHPAAPDCHGEDVRLVGVGSADRPRWHTVAAAATPATEGLAGWTDTPERHWQFHCAVTRAPADTDGAPPRWSGRLQFTPSGWTIGTVPGARRICRYSADTDGSGAVDRPAEAPEWLTEVDGPLAEQNFLVVDGPLPCPAPVAATGAGGTVPWSQANPATVPHQP